MIDLDDVMVDFVAGLLAFLKERYNKTLDFQDVRSYDLWECGIGRDRKEAIGIIDKYHDSEFFDNMPLIHGARESMYELSKKHQLYVVTSRPVKFKEKTERHMTRFPMLPFELHFSGDFHKLQGMTKAQICKSLGAYVVVEDNKEYAKQCAEQGAIAFLYDKPWNQGNVNGNHGVVQRVKSWDEILGVIR